MTPRRVPAYWVCVLIGCMWLTGGWMVSYACWRDDLFVLVEAVAADWKRSRELQREIELEVAMWLAPYIRDAVAMQLRIHEAMENPR